jgi:hypothetical protein
MVTGQLGINDLSSAIISVFCFGVRSTIDATLLINPTACEQLIIVENIKGTIHPSIDTLSIRF